MDTSPHWPLLVTVPLALLFACVLGGYWWRLGLADVSACRRRIRRAGNVVMGLLTLSLVIGMSIADPTESKRLYILIWLVSSGLVLTLLVLAVLDIVNNLKQHARNECQATSETAKMLMTELNKPQQRADNTTLDD